VCDEGQSDYAFKTLVKRFPFEGPTVSSIASTAHAAEFHDGEYASTEAIGSEKGGECFDALCACVRKKS
jgi:hypothetical protein